MQADAQTEHVGPSRAEAGAGRASFARRLDAYGPLLLALYFLATTRWGSYVLPGPPYVGDVAILILLTNKTLLAANRFNLRGHRDFTVVLLGSGLLAWTLMRVIFGPLNVDAARDAAPYIYVVVAFLVVPLDRRQEAIAARMVTVALVAHLCWVSVAVVFGPLEFIHLPWALGGGTIVFGVRPDANVIALGLLAALSLHRALVGRTPTLNLILAGWAISVMVLGLEARASMIAVMFQFLIIALLAPSRGRERSLLRAGHGGAVARGDPRIAVAVLAVAIPIAAVSLPQAPIASSLAQGFSPDAARPFEERTRPAATARARLRSWNHLLDWVNSDPGRMAVGVGMGMNYYRDTGALRLLSTAQREAVRAPHNYWLNTWARLGVIGLVLTLALWLAALRLAVLVVRASEQLRDTDLLAILFAATLPISATFGVLLESPFGAIPFYWAVGHLSVRACALGATPGLATMLRSGGTPRLREASRSDSPARARGR